jgi:GAF domain-containing protein
VPDGEGGFASFITSGMSDELIAAMGPLPRTHGMLGAMLESPAPYRTPDIHTHERFRGWWPAAHPDMRSFLGVPIVARGGIIGALYLTDKVGDTTFSDRRREADRAARRARRDRDRERAAVRAQPRAEHRRGAQPARARAARRGRAAAVRGGARGESASELLGRDPARRASRSSASGSSRAVRWRSCARPSSSCGPRRWRPRGSQGVLRQHVELLRRVSGRAIELGSAVRCPT